MKKKISGYVILVLLLTGLVSFIYPIIGTFISEVNTTRVVIDYEARARAEEQYRYNLSRAEAQKFRSKIQDLKPFSLTQTVPGDNKSVSIYQEGDLEGYIVIPKIDVILPIYKGDSDAILAKGIGRLPKTSPPHGGKGTHCVLTGHSGLSTARLFTDLEKLGPGDVFYIKSNGKYLEYKVMDISKKLPQKAKECFNKESGKDLCTLVTCTPIYVNTHRLLVKGERIKYDGKFNIKVLNEKRDLQNYTAVSVSSAVILSILITTHILRRKGRNK